MNAMPLSRRIPDACAALGVGKSTIYKLAAEGRLTLIRIAGRTVVPESEIVRLASRGTQSSPSHRPVPHLVKDDPS